MSTQAQLRPIPVDDRAWLLPALADALKGGAPILPVAPGLSDDEVQRLQAAELPRDTAVLVRTSGSSGVPKAVALSATALVASAEATHEALGGPGQWLVTLPAHLISGLQMLVRSQVSGIEPVFFDGPFDPAALLEAAERMEHERRYVSLVPVQFARLLDLAEADPAAADTLRGFAGVLVGGQAISLALRQRAHELDVNLRRSYGMTETSGGCVYDGVEIGDTRMRIRGGEVQLSGSTLATAYAGGSGDEVAAKALTDDRFIDDAGTRWYRTGDAGELLGGMLTVTGRLDRVIVSGGEVHHSVLSPSVYVHSWAKVIDSVLLDGVRVGRNARVVHAILDKNVIVEDGAVVGEDLEHDLERGLTVTESGITVAPKGTVISK